MQPTEMPAYCETVEVPKPSFSRGVAALFSAGWAGDIEESLRILRRDPMAADLDAMHGDVRIVVHDLNGALRSILIEIKGSKK